MVTTGATIIRPGSPSNKAARSSRTASTSKRSAKGNNKAFTVAARGGDKLTILDHDSEDEYQVGDNMGEYEGSSGESDSEQSGGEGGNGAVGDEDDEGGNDLIVASASKAKSKSNGGKKNLAVKEKGKGKATQSRTSKGKGRAAILENVGDEEEEENDDVDGSGARRGRNAASDGSVNIQLKELRDLDRKTDLVIHANKEYQNTILEKMKKIASAVTRTEDLEGLLKEYTRTLVAGPQLVVIAAGTQQPTLPWFKHYHGQDLGPHPDGEARDLYLNTIRSNAWTLSEKAALKREIQRFNHGIIAAEAESLGEDITEKLASFDPSYFIESVEDLDWDTIALVIPRRTAIECRIQWLQNDHPSINKVKWTKVEQANLNRIAEEHGCRDWVGIAQELGTQRTASDCLKQYRRRSGTRQVWTAEEDAILREAVDKFGENWQSVARHCGRHSSQCINRWTKTLDPKIKRGRWTAEADALLIAAYAVCGNQWKAVALRIEGRTDSQCRERYCNILDPNIADHKKWTAEDDAKLNQLRDKGTSWAAISIEFKGKRTDNHCKRRYESLQKARAANSRGGRRSDYDELDDDDDDDEVVPSGSKSRGVRPTGSLNVVKKATPKKSRAKSGEATTTTTKTTATKGKAAPRAIRVAGGKKRRSVFEGESDEEDQLASAVQLEGSVETEDVQISIEVTEAANELEGVVAAAPTPTRGPGRPTKIRKVIRKSIPIIPVVEVDQVVERIAPVASGSGTRNGLPLVADRMVSEEDDQAARRTSGRKRATTDWSFLA